MTDWLAGFLTGGAVGMFVGAALLALMIAAYPKRPTPPSA
jgi:hypothetical protein